MSGGDIPTAEQERRAPDLTPGLRGDHRGLNTPRGFIMGGQGANAVTRPEYRGSRWPGRQQAESRRGQGETTLPCLQGGLGVQRAPFLPLGCGDGGSHPAYRVATLSGQPNHGVTWQKAKDRALLTGRSPSAKQARAPQRCVQCSCVTTVPVTGKSLCPERPSLSCSSSRSPHSSTPPALSFFSRSCCQGRRAQ